VWLTEYGGYNLSTQNQSKKVNTMRIQSLHTGFIMPTKGSDQAGAHDIYMPEAGSATGGAQVIGLGFAAEVPPGHVALLLPRSGVGSKFGLEVNNTCGVIDSDYRGEWKAALRTKSGIPYSWNAGDRLLQFLIVPVAQVTLELADTLDTTERGAGGLGHTGK
jgi:dUTP pyrophosphatase